MADVTPPDQGATPPQPVNPVQATPTIPQAEWIKMRVEVKVSTWVSGLTFLIVLFLAGLVFWTGYTVSALEDDQEEMKGQLADIDTRLGTLDARMTTMEKTLETLTTSVTTLTGTINEMRGEIKEGRGPGGFEPLNHLAQYDRDHWSMDSLWIGHSIDDPAEWYLVDRKFPSRVFRSHDFDSANRVSALRPPHTWGNLDWVDEPSRATSLPSETPFWKVQLLPDDVRILIRDELGLSD